MSGAFTPFVLNKTKADSIHAASTMALICDGMLKRRASCEITSVIYDIRLLLWKHSELTVLGFPLQQAIHSPTTFGNGTTNQNPTL